MTVSGVNDGSGSGSGGGFDGSNDGATIHHSSGGTFHEHDFTDPSNNSWTDDDDKVTGYFDDSESGTYMGMPFSSSGSGNNSVEITGISYPGGFNETGDNESHSPPNGTSSGPSPGGELVLDISNESERAYYGYQSAIAKTFGILLGTFQIAQAPGAPAPPMQNGAPFTPQEMAGLDPQDLQNEITNVNAEIANNIAMSNAFSTLSSAVSAAGKTAVSFNLGIVQFDSLLIQGLREAGGKLTGMIDLTARSLNQLSTNYLNKANSQQTYLSQLRSAQRAQARLRALDKPKLPPIPRNP